MKRILLWLIYCLWLWYYGLLSLVYAQDDITLQVFNTIAKDASPRESLVQWYYSIDNFYNRISAVSPTHPWLYKINILKFALRNKLTLEKTSHDKKQLFNLVDSYWSWVTTKEVPLSLACKQRYELVDDRSYALNIPTALTLATLDMESGCGWYKPANGDGVFQLISKDYGTGTLSTGEWILMMYDFAALLKGKYDRYHNANKLSSSDCTMNITWSMGLIQPICLSYTTLNFDSIIKHGALYNGLSGAIIKGNIQPASASYVFGHYTDNNSWSIKDGLLVRIFKVLNYTKTLNQ